MADTLAEPRTMTVEEAGHALGICRALAYQLARSGELPGVLKLGTRYVVSRARLAEALGETNGHGPTDGSVT